MRRVAKEWRPLFCFLLNSARACAWKTSGISISMARWSGPRIAWRCASVSWISPTSTAKMVSSTDGAAGSASWVKFAGSSSSQSGAGGFKSNCFSTWMRWTHHDSLTPRCGGILGYAAAHGSSSTKWSRRRCPRGVGGAGSSSAMVVRAKSGGRWTTERSVAAAAGDTE